ncbi:MAG: UDP-N-acetylglucosamine 2-epimerase (non-hydrolyzing) [Candidatus Omnitrophica bacterium]|nr:UDP-N-acetylglucosamine 2-epimerase (non-hydrolyzing) [Candidatus Omnitrophota bacterium]
MKNILFIFGTRPESIKLAPVIKEFAKQRSRFKVTVCVTSQHREMLNQTLDFFKIKPDYDLDLMHPNQTLFEITAASLAGLEKIIDAAKPDLIFVHGDTSTAFTGALAGFYKKIKVAHVEAGLRSNQKYSPFPEEINRTLVGHLADYHFAPTEKARGSLAREGIKKNVYVVGNTVIDALFFGLNVIKAEGEKNYLRFFRQMDFSKKIILVTGHRRENFGKPFENICASLKDIVTACADVEIIYPVHLNPNIREAAQKLLGGISRIHLIDPVDYSHLIWLMSKSYLVLTDSGGIQEEAPSLGKPVLVMREVTERTEGIRAGTAILVGTSRRKIVTESLRLLKEKKAYRKMSRAVNPYGDGKTSRKIAEITKKLLAK